MSIHIEKVDLFLSAKNLPKMQEFSQTDALAAVFMKSGTTEELKRVGTLPVIKDNANPSWSTPVTVDYLFEVDQQVVVMLYQWDGVHSAGTEELMRHHKKIARCEFHMSHIMRHPEHKVSMGEEKKGMLIVQAESQSNTRDQLCVTFQGEKLANKDGFFGKSDPFIVASRLNEDGSYTVVWKSNKIDNNLNPHWGQAKIALSRICNADLYRPIKLEIFDWDSNGQHDSMGCVETSVNDLLQGGDRKYPVIEEAKKKKKGAAYKDSGHLIAKGVSIEHHPTFTDFISNGMEMSMIVAIDFTGSNGDPAMPDSLHYFDPTGQGKNPYQCCISALGNILEAYDSDKTYQVYGFGARTRKEDGSMGTVDHCFPVVAKGATDNECRGVDGILQAYKDTLQTVTLSGPTLFQPFLQTARAFAASSQCSQSNQKYTVALIITDGTINDMAATKAALEAASEQPLSVIIVGVGSADFVGMEELDGDHAKARTATAGPGSRDIVQFVHFKEQEPQVLAAQVLCEIPDQVLQFMESKKILPNKP